MTTKQRTMQQGIQLENDSMAVPEAPAIPGLTFRHFRGEQDYPAMVAVINGSKATDQLEWSECLEDITRNYSHLVNCDPFRDALMVAVNGDLIGYSRVWWNQERDGKRLYYHFAHLLPAWREKGVRRAIAHQNERRLREIAATHPDDGQRFFEAWANDTETDWASVLSSLGYAPMRYEYDMVRPDLEDIPDLPLPEGLEVRPVKPEHYRLICK
jgi:hypothetical protein